MNDRIRRLPDAEQEVMQAIWACAAPVARTDIEKILFQEHPMAMTIPSDIPCSFGWSP